MPNLQRKAYIPYAKENFINALLGIRKNSNGKDGTRAFPIGWDRGTSPVGIQDFLEMQHVEDNTYMVIEKGPVAGFYINIVREN